ncbi:MAG: rhomboid family intramembrane serine protease [Thermoflexibacteraceae bacterium]|jgi:membrane associated rhomboid family serine protease
MTFYKSLKYTLYIASVFWVIEIFEFVTHFSLSHYGIYPRTQDGLIGILASPFLHGDFPHLTSNTIPFIVLTAAILIFYRRISLPVLVAIYIGTGLGVWLFARSSYHIGASGVIYGEAAFVLFSGIFRKDIKSIALAVAVVLLYGGMVEGILPTKPGVSWESHLIGAIVGGAVAYFFRKFKEDEEEKEKLPKFDDYKRGYRNIENSHLKYNYKE